MGAVTDKLVLVGVLVLVNAIFAGSEIALVSLREGQVERLAEQRRSGRTLARLARTPNRYLSTIQVAITLAGFLASATAAVTLSEPLVDVLQPLGSAARPTAIVAVTAVLSFVTLVLGELAPKRLAMQWAERWALVVARPIDWLATIATPVIWLLSHTTDLVVRLLGGDPDVKRPDVTPEEIHELVTGGDIYEGFQRQVIEGALEVADRTLRQVVTPRRAVMALHEDLSVADGRRALAEAGHSRAPVYDEDLDDSVGYVSILGLVDQSGVVGEHLEAAVVLPESCQVLDALRELQHRRQQLALVISEHGSVEGIVTVEDLVEEIVGEVYDEHDRDLSRVVHHDDGSVEVPGRFPLHDLRDLDVEVGASSETTVSGLVFERLGRLPESDDVVALPNHDARVLSLANRVAERVRLEPRTDRATTDRAQPGSDATPRPAGEPESASEHESESDPRSAS